MMLIKSIESTNQIEHGLDRSNRLTRIIISLFKSKHKLRIKARESAFLTKEGRRGKMGSNDIADYKNKFNKQKSRVSAPQVKQSQLQILIKN
ncbi:MAG: hypothetical protein ABH896_00860 [Candidatus Jacksonbacteria bacterium]